MGVGRSFGEAYAKAQLASGVTLPTRGTALLSVRDRDKEGAVELAEEVFHMPVRLGVPQHVQGLADVVRNPIHATGVGLLLYGRDNYALQADEPAMGGFRDVWERMKSWFKGNF